MTLQDIECFLCVAETMSYTKTAELLSISQPAVTKHIQILEKEFNISLFDRRNKRFMQITDAGTILFDALRKCRSLYEDAADSIRNMAENAPVVINFPKGILTPYEYVKIMNDFAVDILPAKLQVNYVNSSTFADCLERGELIICEEESLPVGCKYNARILTKDHVDHCIIVSKDHPLIKDKNDPVPSDLIGCPVFLSKTTSEALNRKYILYLTKLYGNPPTDIVYTNDPDNVAVMLLANRGITLNTAWTGVASSSKTCVIPTGMNTGYFAAWNPDKIVNQYIQKLINALRRRG